MKRVAVMKTTLLCALGAMLSANAFSNEVASRTMCLGDSITHFGYTEYYLQLFENLRHPGSGLRYYNAGYSGGHVSTGLANWEHERARIRPDRVFAMFGMNDVLWTTFETNATLSAVRKAAVDGAMDRYRRDYGALVDRVRASGVTNIVLVTPSPYDEYSTKLDSERKRNVNEYGLTKAARIVREVAAEKGVPVVDVHAAMTDLCRKHPDRGLCGADRVHPPRPGHLFMAFQYLAAEKDRPVADIALAADGKVLRQGNAVVDNVRARDGVLAFDYAPKALPLPPLEEYATLKTLWPDAARFNRETLAVAGLSTAHRWSLRAEGRELGVFSAAELAAGVNLADLDTPGRRAAAGAAATMDALHDFDRPRRDRACLRRNFESFGIPMTDKAALKAAYDKRLAALKAQKVHWYEWERAASADFLDALDRGPEIAAEEERLYRALAAVRPVKCRLSLLPVKADGAVAGDDPLDRLDYEALVARATNAPTLLFTAAMRDAARTRIAADPAAKAWWTKFRADVDARMAKRPAIPPVGGQWFHWYACPKCGVHLKGETPTRHVCSKCKGVYSGWPYDDAYYFFIHHELGELVRDCGLAGALSGDPKYADTVRRILLGYADAYLTYPRHDNSGPTEKNRDAARAFSQILDESVWLIDLLQGYDAVASEIPAADRARIAERVFRPASDIIHAVDDQPRHILGNHQCWHFSAYALAALVTGDAARLRESMEGLSGCRYQLETGILSDGFWYEGAWGYHFYTASSLMPYFTALNNLGVQPPARFKKMLDAPFGQLTPDWKLPALNDSGRVSFAPGTRPEYYEQAWAWWRDPVYAGWLALKPRTTLHYTLYGEPLPEKGAPLQLESRLYEASGVSVLRNDGNYVLMDHGPHGGWHGHYDKLNLLVWAQGEMFAEDPGCIGYGLPLHWAWYKNSLSHNTLSVDGRQAAADGRLLAFNGTGDVQYVVADAGSIAKGVQVRRAMALRGNLLFDYVVATSADEHLYEWTFHSRGALKTSVPSSPVPLTRPNIVCRKANDAAVLTRNTDPWAWTEDCRDGVHAGTWNAKWSLKSGRSLALFQRSDAGTLRTATGGAHPPSQSLRVAANRVRAKSASFATVMRLDGKGGDAEVELLPSAADGAPCFDARIDGRRFVCRIAPDWSSMSVREE